ncbi:erythromycin esterase-like protein [Deinococcus metalli]|uniref:Erythromycin esterase-like protein n=1 Tax=Deinococcus metalli TaxID=1141878 RepID=A0A7W8NRY8_9DEIO|nr:erythromycin esterase family protein [Deinococcus metalli]MBB5376612.1 erythromycin esterase-like protein [Deinococcus metalli]GHF42781.1 hypothetical protein GCM10017781_18900 [Deinococcus metalli]
MRDLRAHARPVTGADDDLDALVDAIGPARFVLIGEPSHGTHEAYRERARLTRRLIERHGFTAVAVEADWPDAARVNRFVRGQGHDASARDALADFQRFPRWMWRNTEVEAFVTWLRGHNHARPEAAAGFYGLDLYSMHRSMKAVVDYLVDVDPEAARRARERYSCFELFGPDPQAYGYATGLGRVDPCEEQAVQQLLELQRHGAATEGGHPDGDEHFYAEQNARLARNAESYYRSMFRGRDESWNIRDMHMAESLGALDQHLSAQGTPARTVVWAHNSHLGDARGSAMGWQRGELNLGQLTRQMWPDHTFILGQTTAGGSVLAADTWDGPGHVKTVVPALRGSVEDHLRAVNLPAFWLDLRDPPVQDALGAELLQRFIGVIYRPQTERWSHYVETRPAEMYDAVLHHDTTRALTPLDSAGDDGHRDGEAPDTFPTGE